MRVGVVGPMGEDLLAWHVLDALDHLGVEGIWLGDTSMRSTRLPKRFNRVLGFGARISAFQEASSRRIQAQALKEQVDVVLVFGDSLTLSVVAAMRQNGIQTVLWHPDAISNHGKLLYAAGHYSAIFVKDRGLATGLKEMQGLPAHYLPEACNPRVHRPLGDFATDPHVVVAGNFYATRVRLLQRLAQDGFPLRLYGSALPDWAPQELRGLHAGHPVRSLEKSRAFRQAGVVLNNLHPAERGGNARLFEAASCGGIVLSEFRSEEFFEGDSEVHYYTTYTELKSKIRRMLDTPEDYRESADRAALRAHSEHTFDIRVQRILEMVS